MKERGSLVTFIVLLAISLAIGFYMVAPYLQALFIGGILTQIVNPVYRKLRSHNLGPRLAAMMATIFMVLLVVGPLLILTIVAIKEAIGLGQWFLGVEHLSLQELLATVNSWIPFHAFAIDAAAFDTHLKEILQYIGTAGSTVLLDMAKRVPQGVLQLVLACLTCYCLLTEGPKFSAWVFDKLPMAPEIRRGISKTFNDTAISVVMASMAAACAQSFIMMAAFLILQAPSAFFAGGATFILAWIPIFGSAPVWLAGAGYLFWEGSLTKAVIMIAFGIITGTIDNFIRPMVLNGRGEMHPLVSLVSIFGGMQLFGFFGVFLGPIVMAVVITLLQLWPMVGRPFGLVYAADPEDPPKL